jgi:hypothetical protein
MRSAFKKKFDCPKKNPFVPRLKILNKFPRHDKLNMWWQQNAIRPIMQG